MKTEPIPEPADPRAAATAYALDELSATEREAFEQQIENDPALAALAEETRDFCGLLADSLRAPVPALADSKRAELLAAAGRRRSAAKIWIPWVAGAAACLACGFYLHSNYQKTYAFAMSPAKEADIWSGGSSGPEADTLIANKAPHVVPLSQFVSTSPPVTIRPDMPKPLFAGTPLPESNPLANLDKSGMPVLELQVPAGVSLVSRGKPVTCSDPAPLGEPSLVTDGDKQGDDGYFVDILPNKQWIQIDLGESVEIHLIWMWHFHKQAVIYKDVVVQISDDPEFKTATTVYNNDYDNTSGFGAGKELSWVETNNGRPMPVNGVAGRYVRCWSSGRNIDDTNQYIEVEIYGRALTSNPGSLADAENARRTELVRVALEVEREGDALFAKQDEAAAIEKYRHALTELPAGISNQPDRRRLISKYSNAGVIHAADLGRRGEFDKAKSLLTAVLTEDVHHPGAQKLLGALNDPNQFSLATTGPNAADAGEVERLFKRGMGFYDLGQFKEAETEFNRILTIDPYNTAARRGLERSERETTNYFKAARDNTRLTTMIDAGKSWVTAVPGKPTAPVTPPAETSKSKELAQMSTGASGLTVLPASTASASASPAPAGPATDPQIPLPAGMIPSAGIASAHGTGTGDGSGAGVGRGFAPGRKSGGAAKAKADFDQFHSGVGGLYLTTPAGNQPDLNSRARSGTFVIQAGVSSGKSDRYYENLLEQDVAKKVTQLESLRNLKGEQLLQNAAAIGVQDATIQKVYPEYVSERATLGSLEKTGYGPEHPKIVGLKESIRSKEKQLDAAAESYKNSLQVQIDQSRKMLADARQRIVDHTTPGSESYKPLPENPFRGVVKEPLSTFSIDVDTASYSNVRRFLNMGQCPPPEAVRLEELVNYFPYDYAQPVDGKPFAVHVEMTSAPWNQNHRLARIALKGKEIPQTERPAANLVFLVDVSGSMQPENKLPLVTQSLKFVVERLTEKDTVSMVTYAGESGIALPATNGADKARILAAVNSLHAGGSTNGAGGINTAYAQAAMHFNKEGINRVILATDGDFNVGVTSHEELQQLVTEQAKSGVFLSVLGYGMGNTKDDTMELLADKGNGNYAYIDSLSEARKSLADQFSGTLVTIAKDVKLQIEFNPAIIREYRLLGYENRMLAKEDFNNDKKDAGEIGAGHTVTALYELIPAGAPEAAVTTIEKLKYQPQPEPAPAVAPAVPVANASGETMTVSLRWKAPDADVSQLMEVPVKDPGAKLAESSPETRWAVAVAGFAALLNNSQYPGLTWDDVRTLAKGSKGADPNGYRGEFLQLINKAESLRR